MKASAIIEAALAFSRCGFVIGLGRPCGLYECPRCGKRITGRMALSQHLQDKHGLSKRESKGGTP